MSFFLIAATFFGIIALMLFGIILGSPLAVLGVALVIFIERDIGYWPLLFMLLSINLLIILRTDNRISDFLKSIFKK
tara:strand:+ start:263 stop:493 length:231 start_codon:yes stop_codon:yes gene_type:complete